jgi:hypothetical protein
MAIKLKKECEQGVSGVGGWPFPVTFERVPEAVSAGIRAEISPEEPLKLGPVLQAGMAAENCSLSCSNRS